eukprot:CAMPEP_0179246536 /NCGR_PEP_ID=MMETSP0797-20121207/19145_1 /TAXON_ID=47934 /ORGANISM="Dinophysis acuminata, Strain DAEP01" /LENGTH=143 /DNA_ID=CAMNT_0020954129 /DNA_START=66 /DNA_END=498 /DNA_ORIENTATION=-
MQYATPAAITAPDQKWHLRPGQAPPHSNVGKHVAKSDLGCFDSTCASAPFFCVTGKLCLQMVQTWLGWTVLFSFPAPPPPPPACAAAFFSASSRARLDFSPLPPPMPAKRSCKAARGKWRKAAGGARPQGHGAQQVTKAERLD